jgi:REP element-mobilizing transposase RayT
MAELKGWHSRSYLTHFDSQETIQFVTFRLADSLPRHAIERIRMQKEVLQHLDHELDTGLGVCWLSRSEIASLVEAALFHFDGQRYRLLAWCLMPNHVHVVVEMLDGHSLSKVIWSWKSFTAKQANIALRRSGPFWDVDYFDRYMRNEEHLYRTIEYVEQNPVKAGLQRHVTGLGVLPASTKLRYERARGPRSRSYRSRPP